jgi:hypothetical protein
MNLTKSIIAVCSLSLFMLCVQPEGRIGRENLHDPLGVNSHPPALSATANRTAVSIGDTVTITAHANDANGSIIAIEWAPDGSIFSLTGLDSVLRVPCLAAGQKNVLIRAMDNDSLSSAVYTVTINVYAGPSTDGLVAYLPFTGSANDESPSHLSTTVSGAVPTSDRFGNANCAYLFNGSTSTITVADSSVISFTNTQSFTVSLWLKTTSIKANMLPFMKYQYGANNGYFFAMNHTPAGYCAGAGIASFMVGPGSPACAASAINNDAWHLLVGIYSGAGNTVTLYVDGVLQAKTGARVSDAAVGAPITIGGIPAYAYEGAIDDVRIYNRALTQEEITGLVREGGWTGQ